MEFTIKLHKRGSPLSVVIQVSGDPDSHDFTWTEVHPNSSKPFFAAAQKSWGYFESRKPGGAPTFAVFKASGVVGDKRPAVLRLQISRLPEFKLRDLDNCFTGAVGDWQSTPEYKKQSSKGFSWRADPT